MSIQPPVSVAVRETLPPQSRAETLRLLLQRRLQRRSLRSSFRTSGKFPRVVTRPGRSIAPLPPKPTAVKKTTVE